MQGMWQMIAWGKLEEKALIQFFWIAPIKLELKMLCTAF
jgi:hypothetical protein